jgi:hypothetical protein
VSRLTRWSFLGGWVFSPWDHTWKCGPFWTSIFKSLRGRYNLSFSWTILHDMGGSHATGWNFLCLMFGPFTSIFQSLSIFYFEFLFLISHLLSFLHSTQFQHGRDTRRYKSGKESKRKGRNLRW